MSISGTYDSDNIFAKIMAGDIPSVKVYEDDDVLAFMDAFPQSAGHTLVIPKASSRNLLDTDPVVLSTLIRQTQKLAKAVNDGLNPDGIVITQFNGAPAGQTVFHLHFHIIPRYTDAKMKAHASGQMADRGDLEDLAGKIRAALK